MESTAHLVQCAEAEEREREREGRNVMLGCDGEI